jgi:inorganic triphosphatase YgiF
MVDGIEAEIKLAASPAMLERLRSSPVLAGAGHFANLVTTYFDTVDGKLWNNGAALRVRDTGHGHEQTLKLIGPGKASVRRREWNAAIQRDTPTIYGFPIKARAALCRRLDGAPLEEIASARVERESRRVKCGRSLIEVSFDRGTIHAAEREEAVCELELEVVEGRLADAFRLALNLPLGPELVWSVRSKAERCHDLAFAVQPKTARAGPVPLKSGMDVAKAFQTIAWSCLEQLLACCSHVIANDDSEALHQCRVAIRRLRAAFGLFKHVVADETAPQLRAALKAVFTGLGPARERQVLLDQVAATTGPNGHDTGELLEHLGKRRNEAMQAAQVLLASPPFQRLLLELGDWIDDGEWLSRKHETGGDQPIRRFAKRGLSKSRRKLRRRQDGLANMTDLARHHLRVDVKKLRYAEEFFSTLCRNKAASRHRRRFSKAVGGLQDSLGELNDLAVASNDRTELFEGLDSITAARLTAQLDRSLHVQQKSKGKLLKRAERSLHRTLDASPWWKDM